MFSTFLLNVRSLSQNYDNLSHCLSCLDHTFSIIAFTETWMKESVVSLNDLPDHQAFIGQEERELGEVCLFSSATVISLSTEVILWLLNLMLQNLFFVEVTSCHSFGGRNVIVGGIYRPPNRDIDHFNQWLLNLLELISKGGKVCYLIGDFNLNLYHPQIAEFLNTHVSQVFSSFNS